jgi:hypothetical protein
MFETCKPRGPFMTRSRWPLTISIKYRPGGSLSLKWPGLEGPFKPKKYEPGGPF